MTSPFRIAPFKVAPFKVTLLATLCVAAAACQPAGDDAADDAATGADAAMDDATPAESALAGAFSCDDGTSVQLDWREDGVAVRWPDGRSVTLPKAESASGANGDAYVGDTVSVEHDGDLIVLRDGTDAAVTCRAAGASDSDAAITMRYSCDPDTEVTVFADDSARVALPDGQEVRLSRVTGSAPPVFTGDTLFFSIGDTGARLSQGDEANELTCAPA